MSAVLIKSLISEKSNASMTKGRFTFVVEPEVNKVQIKQYFKAQFGLLVADVNIQNRIGKKRRVGRFVGKTVDRKIAVITFKPGQSLEDVEKLF